MRSEQEFIRRLTQRARRESPDLRVGIGDDGAVIGFKPGSDWVVASDLMVEDVHFRRRYFSPAAIGHKALAVNLSDLAAMGAVPRFCLLNLAIPHSCDDEFVNQLLGGLLTLADHYQVALIGGDTSYSPDRLYLDVTVIGELVSGRAVTRSGAQVGDLIFVSGELGNAGAGFALLENPASTGPLQSTFLIQREAIQAHLQPIPRVLLGQRLAEQGLATAMMDVSDGLSLDISRLCDASGVGAYIIAEHIPVAAGAKVVANRQRQDPLDLALHAGEDYELIFTVPPSRQESVEHLAQELASTGETSGVTWIGTIVPQADGVNLVAKGGIKPLEIRGFDHFAKP